MNVSRERLAWEERGFLVGLLPFWHRAGANRAGRPTRFLDAIICGVGDQEASGLLVPGEHPTALKPMARSATLSAIFPTHEELPVFLYQTHESSKMR
jgi:hypothetical protein